VKRVASLVVAIASIAVPGAASAATATAPITPAGALPEQVCTAAAPAMGAASNTPAAPYVTTLCSQ
jgi:hypothetical protein